MFDPFGNMNSIFNQFMMDPFAPPGQRQQRRQQNGSQRQGNQLSLRDPFDPFAISPFEHHNNHPFSLINQMMGNFDGMFRNFDQISHSNDPNTQVFSSSSVMTYSNTDGRPKVFQQSKQIHQGPGGVRETREMLRDSERGVEKVAIGHHIGEKSHIIERQKQNGQVEEIVNLENLDDDEVQAFNQEFENRLNNSRFRSSNSYNTNRSHHHLNNNQPLAIEDSRSKKEKDRKSKSKSKH